MHIGFHIKTWVFWLLGVAICCASQCSSPQKVFIPPLYCDSLRVTDDQLIHYCLDFNHEYYIRLSNGTKMKTGPFLIESMAQSRGIYIGKDSSAFVWLNEDHLFLACPIGLDSYYGRILKLKNKELLFSAFEGLHTDEKYVFLPKKKWLAVLQVRGPLAGQATYYAFDPVSVSLKPVATKTIHSFANVAYDAHIIAEEIALE